VLQRGGADSKAIQLSHPLRGVAFAFLGSFGQAIGLIMSKIGAPSYNAFSATQIRVLAGWIGFGLVIAATRRFPQLFKAYGDRVSMGYLGLGSFFGPFLGVSLGLVAVQLTSVGVASTIMAITPILIIPPAVLFFKEKVNARETAGALLAVAGVALLFLG
jgi:drug/metabolite transporter (DMT)-like permease